MSPVASAKVGVLVVMSLGSIATAMFPLACSAMGAGEACALSLWLHGSTTRPRGRFAQTDPVLGGSANAYDYAEQNPVTTDVEHVVRLDANRAERHRFRVCYLPPPFATGAMS
jgi:hypothetical protein